MVKDYDRNISKELIYGSDESSQNVIECENTREADE
jgi:hypothetical protein